MIVIGLSLRVPPNLRAEFLSGLSGLISASRDEPGVLAYSFAEDVHVENLFRVFEVYQDQAALDAHLGSDHFRAWRATSAAFAREDRWLLDATPRGA